MSVNDLTKREPDGIRPHKIRTVLLSRAFPHLSPQLKLLLQSAHEREEKKPVAQTITISYERRIILSFVETYQKGNFKPSYFRLANLPIALGALNLGHIDFNIYDYAYFNTIVQARDCLGREKLVSLPVVKNNRLSCYAFRYIINRLGEDFLPAEVLVSHLKKYVGTLAIHPSLNYFYIVPVSQDNLLALIYITLNRLYTRSETDHKRSHTFLFNLNQLKKMLSILAKMPFAIAHQSLISSFINCRKMMSNQRWQMSHTQSLVICHEIVGTMIKAFESYCSPSLLTMCQENEAMRLIYALCQPQVMFTDFVTYTVPESRHSTIGITVMHPQLLYILGLAFDEKGYRLKPVAGIQTTRQIAAAYSKRSSICAIPVPGIIGPQTIHDFEATHPFLNTIHDLYHFYSSLEYRAPIKDMMIEMMSLLRQATKKQMYKTLWRIADRCFPSSSLQNRRQQEWMMHSADIVKEFIRFFNFILSRDCPHKQSPLNIRFDIKHDALSIDEALLILICMFRNAKHWCTIFRLDTRQYTPVSVLQSALTKYINPPELLQNIISILLDEMPMENEEIIVLLHMRLNPKGSRALFFKSHRNESLTWTKQGHNIQIAPVRCIHTFSCKDLVSRIERQEQADAEIKRYPSIQSLSLFKHKPRLIGNFAKISFTQKTSLLMSKVRMLDTSKLSYMRR